MKILAIDLGKFNIVACIYDEKSTKQTYQHRSSDPASDFTNDHLDRLTLARISHQLLVLSGYFFRLLRSQFYPSSTYILID